MTVALRATLLVALISMFGSASPVLAQDADGGSPAGQVDLIASALDESADIDLDGAVTEDAWSQAMPITDFTQQEPVEGGTPSYPTEIRVMYDEDNLYIGAIFYDDPDGILAFQRQRDAGLNTDDRFMWILDTFMDGRTGYFFEINPAGLMGDGIIGGGGGGGFRGGGGFGGGGANKAWDGIWEARTARRPDGWSAEIRIPFRTLNFDPNLDTWGINFQRTIRRRNEEILWRGWRRNEGLRSPVYAGQVTGLGRMSQGLGLEAIPSTVASWKNVPTDLDPTTYPADVSLDVNYNVTSSLKASVSINTDFAEVESDQRQVNLTRFSQRFPEQRDFFLEGSGVFSFAPGSMVSPFYSRNIGIRSGRQVPLEYGGRMTGQVGAFELGFYQIGTGELDYLSDVNDDGILLPDEMATIPGEDFTVARVKRGLFEQSTVGALYTRRSTSPDADGFAPETAHTAGVDVDFNTRHFLGGNNFGVTAFFLYNSNPDEGVSASTGDLSARGLRVDFPNDVWSWNVGWRELGAAFDPAVGFTTRNDFRRFDSRVGWQPRPDGISFVRNFNLWAQFQRQTELGTGILEERQFQLQPLGINFESGDGFDFNVTRTREYLDRTFEISDGIFIEGDRAYSTWEYRLFFRTAGQRRVSLFGGFNGGDFWDGSRRGLNARLFFRPAPGIQLSTNFDHNEVSLPGGDFTADVYELEGQWSPNPWVSSTTQFQYDTQSEILGFFGRVRWIVTPGSDLYFVFTNNWQRCPASLGEGVCALEDRTSREFVTLSRGASVKLSYTYRF